MLAVPDGSVLLVGFACREMAPSYPKAFAGDYREGEAIAIIADNIQNLPIYRIRARGDCPDKPLNMNIVPKS